MKNRLGTIGVVVGLLAIAVAIFQEDLRAATSEEETLTDTAQKILKEKFLKEEPEAEKPIRDHVTMVYFGLGFVAIALGVFSWIKKDHVRISGAAVSLGLVAVAWEFVLIGIAIAILILILSNISF